MPAKPRPQKRGKAPNKTASQPAPGGAGRGRGPSPRLQHALWAGGLFLLLWLAGLLAQASYLGGDDSGEFITAAFYLGVQHMPGYPWHALWGWPFSRLAFVEPGFGVALCSMLLFPAGAALAFFWFSPREAVARALAALGVVLLLLCERLVFYQAYTDVYGGTFFLTLLMAGLWFMPHPRLRALWVALAGCALMAHPSGLVMAIVAGAPLWWRGGGGLGWCRLLPLGFFWLLLALCLEWYLPLRSGAGVWFAWGDPKTFANWLRYKTTGPSLQTQWPSPAAVLGHLGLALRDWGALGGLLLPGAGLAWWWRRKRLGREVPFSPWLPLGVAGVYLVLMAVLIRLPDTPFGRLTYAQYYGPVAAVGLVAWLVCRPPRAIAWAVLAGMGVFAGLGVEAMLDYRRVETVQKRLFARTVKPLPFESLFITHLTTEHFLFLYEHGLKRHRPDLDFRDVLGRIWEGGRLEGLRRQKGAEGVLLDTLKLVQREFPRRFVASPLSWSSLGLAPENDKTGKGVKALNEELNPVWGAVRMTPPPPPPVKPPGLSFLAGNPWPPAGAFVRDHLGREALASYLAQLAQLHPRSPRATEMEKQALQLGWESPLVLSMLGQMATSQKHEEDARERLERALALDPAETAHRIALGRLEFLTGHYEEARALLEADLTAVKNQPGGGPLYGVLLLKLGDEAVGKKQFAQALALYDAAMPLLPQTAETLYRRGEALAGAGRWMKAKRTLEKSLRLAEQQKQTGQPVEEAVLTGLYTRLAQTADKVGDAPAAALALEKLLPLRPFDENLHKVLARLYEKDLKKPEKAIEVLQKLMALTRDPAVKQAAGRKIALLKGDKSPPPAPAKDPILDLLNRRRNKEGGGADVSESLF